jgi:hypothetical protein
VPNLWTPPPEPERKPSTQVPQGWESTADALRKIVQEAGQRARGETAGDLPTYYEEPTTPAPVELAAHRRAMVLQRSAEFLLWVKQGLTRQEALNLIAIEMQMEIRFEQELRRREGGS